MDQHSSGRYDEMDTELEIGVEDCARVLMEIEDMEFLEVTVTPLQKIEEMEIFMPSPKGKSTEVKKGGNWSRINSRGLNAYHMLDKMRQINKIFEVESGEKMEHVVDNLTIFGKEKGDSTNFAQFAASLMVHRSYYLPLKWLLDWGPKPMVKMKLMKFVSRVGYEEETTELGKAYKEISEEVSISLDKSGIEPSQWGLLSGIGWMPRPLVHDQWERMNENEDNYLFALLLCQQESSILMAIKESSKMVSLDGDLFACQRIDGKYVERDERAATLERTGVYIVEGDIDDVSRLEKLFELMSFTHFKHLASHVGVRYAMENPSYYVHSNMAGLVKP